MICRKCHKSISDGSTFCSFCGWPQIDKPPRRHRRTNGSGSITKDGSSYRASKIVSESYDEDGARHIKKVQRRGFKTIKDADLWLATVDIKTAVSRETVTLRQLYDKWIPTHRAGKSTLNCYKAAFMYFGEIEGIAIKDIDIDDLQECLDECPHGKRTRQNMKACAGLIYKYGIPRHMVPGDLNLAEYLKVSAEAVEQKEGLTVAEVELIRKGLEKVPYAKYVYAQCYLGFRPSELLALDVAAYDRKNKTIVGGAKTEAGKGRTVTISPKIQPIITELTKDRIRGPIFYEGEYKSMSIKNYREAFYVVLEACGIDNPIIERNGVETHRLTPHSCRHTFATLLKSAAGSDKEKLELIGHTSPEMLRHYQDIELDKLKQITDAL